MGWARGSTSPLLLSSFFSKRLVDIFNNHLFLEEGDISQLLPRFSPWIYKNICVCIYCLKERERRGCLAIFLTKIKNKKIQAQWVAKLYHITLEIVFRKCHNAT